MRTWRFWAEVEAAVEIAGERQVIHARAGSNDSEADARREAERRLDWVRRKIAGAKPARAEGYEADIREEVLEWLGEGAAITRNRYGAQVLNAERLPMLDVDDPPLRFKDWFRRATPERRLERMTEALHALAVRPEGQGLGFRLYATAKGFRVLVLGRELPPTEDRMAAFARRLNVDPLFWELCQRQGCYRARLTPKPFRMHTPTHKVRFPASEEEQTETRRWEEGYLAAAGRFATCRFLLQVGPDLGHPLLKLHDERTGARSGRNLA